MVEKGSCEVPLYECEAFHGAQVSPVSKTSVGILYIDMVEIQYLQ